MEDRNAETRVMRLCPSKAGMAARENTRASASISVKIFSPADRATGLSMAAFSLLMKPYAVCVPVRPGSAPADAVFLPECRVLSVLYCGDYSGIDGGVAGPEQGSKGPELDTCRPASCPRHRGSLYRPGDRCPALLLPACPARRGITGPSILCQQPQIGKSVCGCCLFIYQKPDW